MKYKLEQIMVEMSNTWGPLPIRCTNDAVGCFNRALIKLTKPGSARVAIGQLMVNSFRKAGITSESFLSLDDTLAMLQSHIDAGTTLYEIKGAWAHHAPDDFCLGESESDYQEHSTETQLAMFDKWGDATDLAYQFMQHMISTTPNHVTNIRTEIHMHDGDHEFPLGEWVWDKNTGRTFWCQTSGADA